MENPVLGTYEDLGLFPFHIPYYNRWDYISTIKKDKDGKYDEQLQEAIDNMKKDMDFVDTLDEEEQDHGYTSEEDLHPYDRLCLFPQPGNFSRGLDRDLQYVSLHLKIEDSPSIKCDKSLGENISSALLLKEQYDLLCEEDVVECLSDYMELERSAEVSRQRYEASLELLNDEKAKENYLKNPNEFKQDLMEEYPLLIEFGHFDSLMLDVSYHWRLPECERESMVNMITRAYESRKERNLGWVSRARFLKSKLEKAQNIGLIKVDLPWLSKVEAVQSLTTGQSSEDISKEIEEAISKKVEAAKRRRRRRRTKQKVEKAQNIGLIKVDLPWLSEVKAVHSLTTGQSSEDISKKAEEAVSNKVEEAILKKVEAAKGRQESRRAKQRMMTRRRGAHEKSGVGKGEEASEKTENILYEAHEKLRRLRT